MNNKTKSKKTEKNVKKKNKWIFPVSVASGVIVIACIIIFAVFFGNNNGGSNNGKCLSIVDCDGNLIAQMYSAVSDNMNYEKNEYKAYAQVALSEAINIICTETDSSEEKALQWLINNECIVKTAFDANLFEALVSAYNRSYASGSDFGAAVTDLNGALLCVYSYGRENYAVIPTHPYSSIKPLSVYAPAIENGVIHYSSTFPDIPVKLITGENGEKIEWPQNGVGYFTGKETTVYEAIKLSLNTIAVRCLLENSVTSSFKFLSDKLGVTLDFEAQKMSKEGEEEILSNLALGYLYEGVSPVDMAGFYQIFANGGKYIQPYTITEIENRKGKKIYSADFQATQLISEETAYIMNKLLQAPLTDGGTAQRAAVVDNIPIGGKTGTGTDYSGCWFVSFTPQYSFAIWHAGEKLRRNVTTDIFADMISAVELDESVAYPSCDSISELEYCSFTGMLATENCPDVLVGYYSGKQKLTECSVHR